MMLILTRRLNETIRVGHDVAITILGVKGGQVRVGIAAPKDVPVHREEIYHRIMGEEHRNTRREPPQTAP